MNDTIIDSRYYYLPIITYQLTYYNNETSSENDKNDKKNTKSAKFTVITRRDSHSLIYVKPIRYFQINTEPSDPEKILNIQ